MDSPSPTVDVRGLACSDAVLAVHRELVPMPAGARLRVVTDDEALFFDLKRYASRGGHALERPRTLPGGLFELEVRKGG